MITSKNQLSLNNSISIIIRVSETCNLSCRYCYVKPTTAHKILDIRIIEGFIEALIRFGFTRINLYWHGGEPLLPGIKYYREILSMLNRVRGKTDASIINRLQTNGVLLTKEFATLLTEGEFRVGISMDGDECLNENRVFFNGTPSYKKAMNGLQQKRAIDSDTSILSVLTRNHLANIEHYYSYVKSAGLKSFKINPCMINKQQSSDLQVSPREWGGAMIKLFDLWFFDANPPMNREFSDILKSMYRGYSKTCVFNKTCFKGFLSIVPSGDIYPCARLIHEDDTFRLGNVDDGMDVVFANYKILNRDYDNLGCSGCKWEPICHGGCTAYAYWLNGTINSRDYLCEGYKMLFQHIHNTVNYYANSKES